MGGIFFTKIYPPKYFGVSFGRKNLSPTPSEIKRVFGYCKHFETKVLSPSPNKNLQEKNENA